MATRAYSQILAIYLVDLLHRRRRRQVRRRQMPYRGEKISINPRFGNSRHSHRNSHCFMSLSFTFCCWFSVEGLSLWIMYVKIMPTTFCSLGCQPTSKRTIPARKDGYSMWCRGLFPCRVQYWPVGSPTNWLPEVKYRVLIKFSNNFEFKFCWILNWKRKLSYICAKVDSVHFARGLWHFFCANIPSG